jgi:hypothetical protein
LLTAETTFESVAAQLLDLICLAADEAAEADTKARMAETAAVIRNAEAL